MATSERQAKKRQKRFSKVTASFSETCTRTSSRRASLASPDSHKYCSGLIPLRCAEEMLEELETMLHEDDMPRRKTLLAVFDHWTQKRKRSNGLPLLKSLHPSVTAASGTFLLNSIHARDVQSVYLRLLNVRNYLHQLRLLAAAALAKERLMRNQMMAKLHLYQNLFDPHRSALIHVLRTVATDFDPQQDFLSRATTEHPYDWQFIMGNIHNGVYDNDADEPGGGNFVRDLLLVVDPTSVDPSLKETAQGISQSILKLQHGDVTELERTRDPLTIVLPVALIQKYKTTLPTVVVAPTIVSPYSGECARTRPFVSRWDWDPAPTAKGLPIEPFPWVLPEASLESDHSM